jgi:uncharacterized LabA/DUF88 family protein
MIRGYGLEPEVILERRKLTNQRECVLKDTGVIEKPKGVDIALCVRMLEDAYRNNFSTCFLLTSDMDFLPVIQAVRRIGKQVYVLGYRSGLSKQSPFEYVPDHFFDIGMEFMKTHCEPRKVTPGVYATKPS